VWKEIVLLSAAPPVRSIRFMMSTFMCCNSGWSLVVPIPVSEEFAAERAEYNRLIRSYYERVRDFQCAFYALSPYVGAFWQQLRPRAMPPPLEHKIATFERAQSWRLGG